MEESYLENEETIIKTLIEVCNLPKDVIKYVICKYLENKVYSSLGIFWTNDKGELHRDNDKPAIEWANGTKQWYKNGKHHRDDDISTGEAKPAVEYPSGTKLWYKNGEYHRDGDKPAIEYENGDKVWYKNGNRHRDGDISTGEAKPAIEWANGDKEWYKNGIRYSPEI